MHALARKGLTVFLAFAVLLSIVLATGCAASKSGYEERMLSILVEAKKDLDNNHKELAKAEAQKDSKQKDQKKKGLIEKQIEVLEATRDKVEGVSAPDDFFAGHSDLVEFLELLIKSREVSLKNIGKKASAGSSVEKSEAFETFQFSGRAFSRASNELPFLEYELRNTFETVLQDVQMDIQQQSGFGTPTPGAGSVGGPGRSVP